MDLAEVFKYGLLVCVILILVSNARVGPEISRRMTNLGTMGLGVSLVGWAVTSRPVADGALAAFATACAAGVAILGIGCLAWGWRRHRRDRRIDAGLLPDNRDDPLSAVERQRTARQIRAHVAGEPSPDRADREAEANARAGRSRAIAMVVLGVALMLAPLLFGSVRNGTLDGSPTSLAALALLGAGSLLTLVGRARWIQHTRREQQALDSHDRTPTRN